MSVSMTCQTLSVDRVVFVDSTMIQSAIVHELEVIGEATKALTKEFRDAHPKVPWKG